MGSPDTVRSASWRIHIGVPIGYGFTSRKIAFGIDSWAA